MKIKEGFVMVYYCFDIGDDVSLSKVEKVLGKSPEISQLTRLRLSPSYVQYRVPPLLVRLGKNKVGGKDAEVDAKIYDFGVMTIRMKIPFAGTFGELANLSASFIYSRPVESFAKKYMKKIFNEIKPAVISPIEDVDKVAYENYAIFLVKKFDKHAKAASLLQKHRLDIAKVIKCDNKNLSFQEVNEAVRGSLSYYDDELVVIDWNSSFIYDTSASYEVPEVIEFAVIEGLEMRYYDMLLDSALYKAYSDIEKKGGFYFALSPYKDVLNSLVEVKLGVTETVDKISNSIKLVGDVYLAKVYKQASSRLGLEQWKSSVREKLSTITSIYSMLGERIDARRMIILEILIVIFFLIDIIFLFKGA